MDADLHQEIAHLRELILNCTKRIKVLEKQAAGFGSMYIPAHLQLDLDEAREQVQINEGMVLKRKEEGIKTTKMKMAAFHLPMAW